MTLLYALKVDTMANRVTCVTQNNGHVIENHDTFMMKVVNTENSWNIAEDVMNVSVNNSDLGVQRMQHQDGVSTDVCRLPYDCVASNTTTSQERDLSCSNHGLPTQEQGARSTRRCRRHNTLIGDRPIHNRRSIHDMTKPLKSWLYNHKDNPYPTKNDKLTLSASSEMTLIQVSNWFANARRRLKNTVRQSGLTKNRVKFYNKQSRENADQLSVASSGSGDKEADFTTEGEMPALGLHECPLNTRTSSSSSNNQSQPFVMPSTVVRADPQCCLRSQPSSQIEVFTTDTAHLHKFKQNILHRYLHDSVQHQHFQHGALPSGTRTPSTVRVFNNNRDSMGSTGDEDILSTSPNSTGSDGNRSLFQDGRSSYGTHNSTGSDGNQSLFQDGRSSYGTHNSTGSDGNQSLFQDGHSSYDAFQNVSVSQMSQNKEAMQQTLEGIDTYRKELVAAMVLTNMARAKRHLLPLGMMT